ncbi:hypothetical protein [Prolixibacter sp. NT017]|uniref:hypothetical protein n=1 Tax=Prolixibacter sp. NT017 TaxID=2652390 RepID=UPI001281001C|nr:hypothetical protein [Prolixibacter sp. NT017]GET25827.1 hypothetical protein NT017_21560 [Prolixibacter sp. NT017]
MKTLVLIFTMITFLSAKGFSQQTDANKLLENQETRQAIFKAIAGNPDMMSDFMKVAKQNKKAMMMMNNETMGKDRQMGMGDKQEGMHGNKDMMGKGKMMEKGTMMSGENMSDRMEMMNEIMDNPGMRQQMLEKMMNKTDKDTAMRNQFMHIMSQHPEMMKMMQEKSMMKSQHMKKNKMEKQSHMKNK